MSDATSYDPKSSRRQFIRHTGLTIAAAGAGRALIGNRPHVSLAAAQQPTVPGPPKPKSRWAVVGLGKLALEEILPAFSQCDRTELLALVSGDRDKAQKTARHYGLDTKNLYDYESFDRIADNQSIDVVYICLPNDMHAEYTIRALRAGKHVLCEKPLSVTVEEAQRMVDASKQTGRKLMTAYRLRYEPFTQSLIEMAHRRDYGKIKLIQADNVQDVKAPNIRLERERGGGPLGDVGVYCLNAARYITGEEPIEATAMLHRPSDDPRFTEVDESIVFTLRFPSGVLAHCSAGFGAAESRACRVMCADGWINLDNAFAYTGLRLTVGVDKGVGEIRLPHVNHFAAEMDHFSDCVQNDKRVWTPGEEGLADMKAMAAILESARSGKSVKI